MRTHEQIVSLSFHISKSNSIIMEFELSSQSSNRKSENEKKTLTTVGLPAAYRYTGLRLLKKIRKSKSKRAYRNDVPSHELSSSVPS
jgi:hypothetical protein